MGIRVLVAKFLRVMPRTLILHEPFCSWSLLACCKFYTCQNLVPPNFGDWCMLYIFYTCPTLILKFSELGACRIFYTCPALILQIREIGACCSFTHAQQRSTKSWSLRHAVYLTHAQPWYCNFQSLSACWMIYCTHAQPWSSKFWSLGMLFNYTCPTLILQILELAACCIFDTGQPWSSKILELDMGFICHTCPTSIFQI